MYEIWKNKLQMILVILIVITLVLMGVTAASGKKVSVPEEKAKILINHPILIQGDTELKEFAKKYGFKGMGTSFDPLVIENLKVVVSDGTIGLAIEDTSMTIIIKNCYFIGLYAHPMRPTTGLYVYEKIDNSIKGYIPGAITVEDIIFKDLTIGASLSAPKIVVKNNVFIQSHTGEFTQHSIPVYTHYFTDSHGKVITDNIKPTLLPALFMFWDNGAYDVVDVQYNIFEGDFENLSVGVESLMTLDMQKMPSNIVSTINHNYFYGFIYPIIEFPLIIYGYDSHGNPIITYKYITDVNHNDFYNIEHICAENLNNNYYESWANMYGKDSTDGIINVPYNNSFPTPFGWGEMVNAYDPHPLSHPVSTQDMGVKYITTTSIGALFIEFLFLIAFIIGLVETFGIKILPNKVRGYIKPVLLKMKLISATAENPKETPKDLKEELNDELLFEKEDNEEINDEDIFNSEE